MKNSNQQNLELIAQAIKTAQRLSYDVSPYYILWGSTILLASIIQYILVQLQSELNGIGWIILIPSALIIQFILIRKNKKIEKTVTHVGLLMTNMWIAFGITLFIILLFSNKIGLNTYPIILCLYAISTFISGTAFKIKAFLIGSIFCWIFAIIGFYMQFQIQLLLLASGVLFAFIIPGIILRANEKKEIK
jgi:hypothetical protein